MSSQAKHTYRNPLHRPGDPSHGPPEYQTDARPAEYRGYLIFHRLPACYDIVRDGVCVAQRAGSRGARDAVDAMIAAATAGES